MIVSDAMIDVLSVIRRKECAQVYAGLSRSNPNLGNRLIKLFYQTSNVHTRELITEFMTLAGAVWLRKLLTRDTDDIASTQSRLASLDDYLGLLVVNDSSLKPRSKGV